MSIWISSYGALLISILTFFGILANVMFVRQVKVHINSRMTELLELTQRAAHAEGVKDADAATAVQTAVAQTTASTAAAAAVASEIVDAKLKKVKV